MSLGYCIFGVGDSPKPNYNVSNSPKCYNSIKLEILQSIQRLLNTFILLRSFPFMEVCPMKIKVISGRRKFSYIMN